VLPCVCAGGHPHGVQGYPVCVLVAILMVYKATLCVLVAILMEHGARPT